MKKVLSILLLGAMLVGTLASCGGDDDASTTAATTTKAPTTTTKPNVVVTTPPPSENDGPVVPDPETPMVLEEVENWQATHTLINDQVDPEGFWASQIGFFADGGMLNLFDEVDTADEWNAIDWEAAKRDDMVDTDGSGAIGDVGIDDEGNETYDGWTPIGKMGYSGANAALYWTMKEPVTLGSYVIITGNDNSTYKGRNPEGWYIFGHNGQTKPEDAVAYSGTSALALASVEALEDAGWVVLDYVFDGAMADADFTAHGYVIDEDKQGEYQNYCWFIEYGGSEDNLVQVSEMLLFAAD